MTETILYCTDMASYWSEILNWIYFEYNNYDYYSYSNDNIAVPQKIMLD